MISFRIEWLDLLAVQKTLQSLLQHYSSKASVLQHSAFIMVQLSHPYMTNGKTIALTRRTFADKVMSLLFIQYQKICYLLTLYCVVLSRSFVSDSLRPHRLYTTRLLCPWNFSSKNTGAVCNFFLQGIFLTEGSNLSFLCLLHWQVDSLPLFQIRKCL